MGQRTNLLLQVERFGKPSEEGVCSLFRGEERSANGHGRSGARLNRVYHLQWGYRKYLPMAFLRLLSSRFFKPETCDINRDTKANTMTSSPTPSMPSLSYRERNTLYN